jgi:hypothetical protein
VTASLRSAHRARHRPAVQSTYVAAGSAVQARRSIGSRLSIVGVTRSDSGSPGASAFERKPDVHLRLVNAHKVDDLENLVTRYEVTANDDAAAPEQVSAGVTPDTLRR